MLEAIFWDNDGVLVDTEALFFAANREIMREHGVELDRATFVEWSLRRGKSVIDMMEGKTLSEREALRARRNEVYEASLRRGVRVYDGVESCLRSLHPRVPMAVVTSSRQDHFEVIHAQTGLLKYFEVVLSGGDYPRHKPHPDPYLAAAERLSVDPAHCLVVEDSARGLAAARAAGMRCVVIPNELVEDADWSGAHAVVANVSEVTRIAQGLL